MSEPSNRQLATIIQKMIVERQRLLIREADYLRALVGLPPVASVKVDERKGEGGRK